MKLAMKNTRVSMGNVVSTMALNAAKVWAPMFGFAGVLAMDEKNRGGGMGNL